MTEWGADARGEADARTNAYDYNEAEGLSPPGEALAPAEPER